MQTTSIAIALTLAGMLGCSTPQPVEPRQADVAPRSAQAVEPALHPSIVAQLQKLHPRLAPPSDEGLPDEFEGKPCQLGTSCLAMDPRPFEICLLGANIRCGDKIAEAMRVENAGEGTR
jgi:hypothetical protein